MAEFPTLWAIVVVSLLGDLHSQVLSDDRDERPASWMASLRIAKSSSSRSSSSRRTTLMAHLVAHEMVREIEIDEFKLQHAERMFAYCGCLQCSIIEL